MKPRITFTLLLALFLALLIPAPPAKAQRTFALIEPVTIMGASKDSVYTHGAPIDLRKSDSIHAFLEFEDSLGYYRLLGVAQRLSTTNKAISISDSVLIHADTAIHAGVQGITYQDIQQAFGGAVPPVFQFVLFVSKTHSAHWRKGKQVALTGEDYPINRERL
jgi:hypothetical protein